MSTRPRSYINNIINVVDEDFIYYIYDEKQLESSRLKDL